MREVIFGVGLLALSLVFAFCRKDEPVQPPSQLSYIQAYVFYDSSGVPGVSVTIDGRSDTLRTDVHGLATFSLPAGHYIVKALNVHGNGPGFPITRADTVDSHTGDTTHVSFFDCLGCVGDEH